MHGTRSSTAYRKAGFSWSVRLIAQVSAKRGNESPAPAGKRPAVSVEAAPPSTETNASVTEDRDRTAADDAGTTTLRRSGRAGAGEIDLFNQSEYAQWTEFDLTRSHQQVRDVQDQIVHNPVSSGVWPLRLSEVPAALTVGACQSSC